MYGGLIIVLICMLILIYLVMCNGQTADLLAPLIGLSYSPAESLSAPHVTFGPIRHERHYNVNTGSIVLEQFADA